MICTLGHGLTVQRLAACAIVTRAGGVASAQLRLLTVMAGLPVSAYIDESGALFLVRAFGQGGRR